MLNIENIVFPYNQIFIEKSDVKALDKLLLFARENGKTIHMFEILNNKNLDRYQQEIFSFLEFLKFSKVKNFYQHLFVEALTRNDVKKEIKELQKKGTNIENFCIASATGIEYLKNLQGRRLIFEALGLCKGTFARNIAELLSEKKYENTDEMEPTVLNRDGIIKNGDIILLTKDIVQIYGNEIKLFLDSFSNLNIEVCVIEFKDTINVAEEN